MTTLNFLGVAVRIPADWNIDRAVSYTVEIATSLGTTVTFVFNDIPITVSATTNTRNVTRQYMDATGKPRPSYIDGTILET